jgi:hypothetical protein
MKNVIMIKNLSISTSKVFPSLYPCYYKTYRFYRIRIQLFDLVFWPIEETRPSQKYPIIGEYI